MKPKVPILLSFFITIFLQGCLMKLSKRDGKTWWYKKPISFSSTSPSLDTGQFHVQTFNYQNFLQKVAYLNGKRIVEMIAPKNLVALSATDKTLYIYLYLPNCSATKPHIRRLDSLARKGMNILVISLSKSDGIEKLLKKTSFSQYPYYIINPQKSSLEPILTEINFIREACASCYEEYKDELIDVDYLVLEKSMIRVVRYDAPKGQNILRD
ncbi:MAG: hypothetical protein ABI169_07920 [Chitinophagaceae bacterium]